MRTSVFFLCVFISVVTRGQSPIPRIGGCFSLGDRPHVSGASRDVIWFEDFANGIPSEWSSSETGGIASWEYRGPSTDPNNEVGSRGSCIAPGTVGQPIMSPSAANGFVIFDSNWWDNPNMPCSPDNFGTGPAPAPHYAMLTTGFIDLSNYSGVALLFNHYYNLYQGALSVELSNNGGITWFPLWSSFNEPNTIDPASERFIQISPYAANQSFVQLRFTFSGTYYHWQLDDVRIVDTYANDLSIRNSTFGDFNMTDPAHPTGYEFMEYSKYPDEMPPLMKFSSTVNNVGAQIQNDCRLHVEITNAVDNSLVHSATSAEGFAFVPGQEALLRAATFQMPPTIGSYRVAFSSTQLELDEFSPNNVDTIPFRIDDVQYARDELFASAVYLGLPEWENIPFEIGNVFLVTAPNLSCHSITVGVGQGSSTPAQIKGYLYSFSTLSGVNATLLGTTEPLDLMPSMFNGYGDQILTNLNFATPIPVQEGTAYFVAVGSDQGVDNFVCALSGDAEDATALVHFEPSSWYYVDRKPMVRMNFGFFNTVTEKQPSSRAALYPCPAKNEVTIVSDLLQHQQTEITIIDAMGRCVKRFMAARNPLQQAMIDVSELSVGVYQVVLSVGSTAERISFIKE
ncbi:MAG: T9SS type A sorting domain-containing protein [Flavobacteriales bacterium]